MGDKCETLLQGMAGRLQGHRGENLRSIERETNTFCFITDDNLDPGSRTELMLIFGRGGP